MNNRFSKVLSTFLIFISFNTYSLSSNNVSKADQLLFNAKLDSDLALKALLMGANPININPEKNISPLYFALSSLNEFSVIIDDINFWGFVGATLSVLGVASTVLPVFDEMAGLVYFFSIYALSVPPYLLKNFIYKYDLYSRAYELCKVLLSSPKAKVDSKALSLVNKSNFLFPKDIKNFVKTLHGDSSAAKDKVFYKYSNDDEILKLASTKGWYSTVNYLLARGADPMKGLMRGLQNLANLGNKTFFKKLSGMRSLLPAAAWTTIIGSFAAMFLAADARSNAKKGTDTSVYWKIEDATKYSIILGSLAVPITIVLSEMFKLYAEQLEDATQTCFFLLQSPKTKINNEVIDFAKKNKLPLQIKKLILQKAIKVGVNNNK